MRNAEWIRLQSIRRVCMKNSTSDIGFSGEITFREMTSLPLIRRVSTGDAALEDWDCVDPTAVSTEREREIARACQMTLSASVPGLEHYYYFNLV